MPEFIAETTGTVGGTEWNDLSPFLQGYLTAMLFTETSPAYAMEEWFSDKVQNAIEEGTSDGSIPSDAGYSDLDPDALIVAHRDCGDFEQQSRHILSPVYVLTDYTRERAGHDFWFTRNGHGTGFWDRKELENLGAHEAFGSPRVNEPGWSEYAADRENSPGRKLTEIARKFGSVDVFFVESDDSPTGHGMITMS